MLLHIIGIERSCPIAIRHGKSFICIIKCKFGASIGCYRDSGVGVGVVIHGNHERGGGGGRTPAYVPYSAIIPPFQRNETIN